MQRFLIAFFSETQLHVQSEKANYFRLIGKFFIILIYGDSMRAKPDWQHGDHGGVKQIK